MDVRGKVISADCHIDLIWLPPELFTEEAPAHLRERMPYVDRNDQGRDVWVSRSGAYFGLVNGMGSAGREYVPGVIHRSDRMADKGLYEDGAKGIRRLTEPELRVRDQDLDGVRGEVLYGILGAANRLNDPEAAVEVMRIYNEWLADFSETHPDRFAGIACIPNHDIEAAVAEIERVAKRGAVRGLEIANTLDMKPLYHGHWNPLWEAVDACGLPVHIHTIGGKLPETEGLTHLESRAAFATFITGFQLKMADKLMEAIYGGVLERYPRVRLVIGEAGIGWIPYVLEHMDLEWEDQFQDLELKMKPSEYWRRQCFATYQSDPIGVRLIDVLGEDNVMWGSDFPPPRRRLARQPGLHRPRNGRRRRAHPAQGPLGKRRPPLRPPPRPRRRRPHHRPGGGTDPAPIAHKRIDHRHACARLRRSTNPAATGTLSPRFGQAQHVVLTSKKKCRHNNGIFALVECSPLPTRRSSRRDELNAQAILSMGPVSWALSELTRTYRGNARSWPYVRRPLRTDLT